MGAMLDCRPRSVGHRTRVRESGGVVAGRSPREPARTRTCDVAGRLAPHMPETPTRVLTSVPPESGSSGTNGKPEIPDEAEAEEAAAGSHPRGAREPRARLDRLRNDDGRLERPARPREPRGVPAFEELGGLRPAHAQGRRPGAPRQDHEQPEPDTPAEHRYLAEHQERRSRDRGPALLPARRRGLQGHRPSLRPGRPPVEGGPGRIHDHPAVREERDGGAVRPFRVPEAARGSARLPPRTQVDQAEGAHPVPQQRLLRQRRVRCRGRGPDLLRHGDRGRRGRHPRTRGLARPGGSAGRA